jgi:hypothetical protein
VTALFGRAAELARLRPWLAEAVGGLPRVVVCSGKEGIGKTRLLEAFSDAAESVGRRCSGRGRWRLASTPPYWLWEQLFGPDAVASCGCGRQAGSDPKRAAPLSHLFRARLPTLGPLSRLPEIAVPEASGRASHGDSTLGAFLVFARLHARPSHTLPVKRVLRFDIAQPERRYDVTPVTRAGAYLAATRVASGGRGGQKSWIRRRGWHAGHEHGWLGCGCRCAYVMRWRWQHRGIGSAITLSKPTAHTDCVPADHHQVGSAHGGP